MADGFWNVFRDTGDPLCYLLSRAGERNAADGPDKTEAEGAGAPSTGKKQSKKPGGAGGTAASL